MDRPLEHSLDSLQPYETRLEIENARLRSGLLAALEAIQAASKQVAKDRAIVAAVRILSKFKESVK